MENLQIYASRFNRLKKKDKLAFCQSVVDNWEAIKLEEKSEQVAQYLKGKGNEAYAKQNWAEALQIYNEALCHAPEHSPELALIYANRSAVYLAARFFNQALANIQLALDNGYPSDRRAKLENRRALCLTQMKTEEGAQTTSSDQFVFAEPKLSCARMQDNPFVADCLEFKITGGRHWELVVKKGAKIKPGENLIVEEPLLRCIDEDGRYTACTYCLRPFDLNLIPCPSCTSAAFCSKKCMVAALVSFHRYDCGLPWPTGKADVKNSLKFWMRAFLTAIQYFPTVEDMKQLLADVESDVSGILKANFNTDSIRRRIKVLLTIKNATEEKAMPELEAAFGSTVLLRQLKSDPAFATRFSAAQDYKILHELLFKLCSAPHAKSSPVRVFGEDQIIYGETYTTAFISAIPQVLDWNLGNSYSTSCGMGEGRSPRLVYTLRSIKPGDAIRINEYLKEQVDYNSMMIYDPCLPYMEEDLLEMFLPDRGLNLETFVKNRKIRVVRGMRTTEKELALETWWSVYADFLKKYEHFWPCKELFHAEILLCVYKRYVYNLEISGTKL